MPSAPLDSLETALNMARVRLLDAIQSLSGDILTDTQPFTIVYVNAAWRRLQEVLVSFGVTWNKSEIIFPGVASVTPSDPGTQVYVNWANYFNGTSLLSNPVLPQNLITPLTLWERQNGTTAIFTQMDRLDNGLPAAVKGNRNGSWEWRGGAIYMPGATQATDIRLRYAAFFSDFVPASTTAFASQPIPILRALNPLAWFICSEAAKARADADSEAFDKLAFASTKFFFDLDSLDGKSIDKDSEYGSMTTRLTRLDGPSGPRGAQQ